MVSLRLFLLKHVFLELLPKCGIGLLVRFKLSFSDACIPFGSDCRWDRRLLILLKKCLQQPPYE